MKILTVTAHPYLPQLYGGLQTSVDQLCRSLMERGHHVSVLSGLTGEGLFGLSARAQMFVRKKLLGHKISKDSNLGYTVWRTWFPWEALAYVAEKEKPDLIVIAAGEPARMALAAKPTGIPLLMKLQNVEFQLHGMDFKKLGDITCVANSNFTANKYRNAYGVTPAVIYPFMALDKYKTDSTRENVTFINPVPEKGRDIALEIARQCPDIPFSFVEAWPLSDAQRCELNEGLTKLANVHLVPPQKDMRRIYGKCKILLMPSLWEEAYGRVATEAQISGIPVIASSRGGLPEAVGPGGALIDIEAPIDAWIQAVRKLWNDKAYYQQLSVAALEYAHRPELRLEHQIDAYERVFAKARNSTGAI